MTPTLPLETSALVVESSGAGFKRMPITLTKMRPDELLIEMKFSGICHTDIVASQGHYPSLTYPCVLGHEGAGIIRAVGSEVRNPELRIGTAVLLSFNHCGTCKNCKSGHPACCRNFENLNITGRHLDDSSTTAKMTNSNGQDVEVVTQFFGQSSLARHSIVSQNSVVVCPDPENLDLYAPLGCGFQTGAGTILNALKPGRQDSIAIFGAGAVGFAAVMAAKDLGIQKVVVIDLVDEKLELAKELGATDVVKGGGDVVERIHEITGCEGVRYAIDCTGVSSVLEQIQDCVACGGTVVIVGSPKPEFVMKIPLSQFLHVNKTVRGICQGDSIPEKFIPEMIELHRAGRFPIEKLCKVYSISDIDLAVADVRAGKTIKPVLKWD